jgi:hypothetical protein
MPSSGDTIDSNVISPLFYYHDVSPKVNGESNNVVRNFFQEITWFLASGGHFDLFFLHS